MNKVLLTDIQIPHVIRQCYESDKDYINKFHETSDKGLDFCINQTVSDFILNDVKIYGLYDDKFIGYFGEESFNNEKYLTGFWVMPEFRKKYKNKVWNFIVKHFNGNFKAGLYSKNTAGISFLTKNGCKLMNEHISIFGPAKLFTYKEII